MQPVAWFGCRVAYLFVFFFSHLLFCVCNLQPATKYAKSHDYRGFQVVATVATGCKVVCTTIISLRPSQQLDG